MWTQLRRFLVLVALMFWQGGFTFYAAVVVPLGRQVDPLLQSVLTARVTNYLNLAGAIALLPLGWDVAVSRRDSPRRRLRWLAWYGMLLTLIGLAWLHRHLETLLAADHSLVLQPSEFHPRHRFYLWLSTLQWAGAVVYTWWTLRAWRSDEQKPVGPNGREPLPPTG